MSVTIRVHNAMNKDLIAQISVLATLYKLLNNVCAKIRTTKRKCKYFWHNVFA